MNRRMPTRAQLVVAVAVLLLLGGAGFVVAVRDRNDLLVLGAAVPLSMAATLALGGRKIGAVGSAQQRALASLAGDARVVAVRCRPFLRPIRTARLIARPAIWLEVGSPTDDRVVGAVAVGTPTRRFDPGALALVASRPPSPHVGLFTVDRSQWLLPVTPLTTGIAEAPWSAAVVDLLGWWGPAASARASAPLPSAVGGRRRVSLGRSSLPSSGAPGLGRAIERARRVSQLGPLVLMAAALLLVVAPLLASGPPSPATLVPAMVVALLALGGSLAGHRWAVASAAAEVRAHRPDLAEHADAVAVALHALWPYRIERSEGD